MHRQSEEIRERGIWTGIGVRVVQVSATGPQRE